VLKFSVSGSKSIKSGSIGQSQPKRKRPKIPYNFDCAVGYILTLKELARRYDVPDVQLDERVRGQFAAGCSNDRIRERLLQAAALAPHFAVLLRVECLMTTIVVIEPSCHSSSRVISSETNCRSCHTSWRRGILNLELLLKPLATRYGFRTVSVGMCDVAYFIGQ